MAAEQPVAPIPGWGQMAKGMLPASGEAGPRGGWFGGASRAELEERLTGRALAWIGGLALIAGAVFFVSLAFSRGWIGPEARVILGLAGGLFAFGLGAWLFEQERQRTVAHVLVAVGLGAVSVSLMAATRLYALIPVELGLAAALIVAVLAAALAIRANTQVVAGFGLLAVMAAPPLMGASPDLVTMAFLAAALVGTTAIALFRAWPILPGIAFVLTAPQLASWVVESATNVTAGLVVVTGFWLVNEVAAAGEEVFRRSRVLRPTTATLVVANAAYLVAAGFALLDGSLEVYRGTFLAAVAAAHFIVGGWFLRTEGDRHLFGLLVTGTGLAALTIAVPVQFGAPVVPVAWAAEAVVLTWLWVRRDHVYSAAAAAVIGTLAVAHLVLIELPLPDLGTVVRPDVPFTDPAGLATVFVVAALVVASRIVRRRWERATVLGVGLLVAAYALPFEMVGLAVLVGWAAMSVGGVGFSCRVADGVAERPTIGGQTGPTVFETLESSVWAAGTVAGFAAIGHALANELPLRELGQATLPAVPFVDPGGVAIIVLTAGAIAIAWLDGRTAVRRAAILVAGAVVTYGVTFEVTLAASVVVWAGLSVLYAWLARRVPADEIWWMGTADTLVALGAAVILVELAPPERLIVDAGRTSAVVPFLNGASAAMAALAAALVACARLHPSDRWVPVREAAAAVVLVYLASVGVVDIFQARLGDNVAAEELAKQAQVALSVLWAVIGGTAFAAGVISGRARVREGGLVLLALVSAKVFLVDLAALDVAYRVMSLLALGAILLASAYLFARFRPAHPHV
jgi:uncharacterized membrane protein